MPAGPIQALLDALGAFATTSDARNAHVSALRYGRFALWIFQREDMGEISDGWVCSREDGQSARCLEIRMDRALPIDPVQTLPSGWLLLVDEPGYRSGRASLGWLDLSGDDPTWATLPVGSMTGIGAHCGFTDSYCLWMDGLYTPYVLLSPTCVQIEPSIAWSTVHVRAQYRWAKRKHGSAPPDVGPKPGTYTPVRGKWVASACGSSPSP